MKQLLLAFLLLPALLPAQSDCSPARYRALMREANTFAFGKSPNYQLAINKLQSARTCQPDSEAVVNVLLLKVFNEVNRQRSLAVENERLARENAEATRIEKEKAEKTARSATNLATALIAKETNQTLALRMLQYNAWRHPQDNVTAFTYYKIVTDTGYEAPMYITDFAALDPAIESSTFSSDGQWVLLKTESGATSMWSMKTKRIEKTVMNPLAFSPSNNWALTSNDGTLRVIQLQPDAVIKTLDGIHPGVINAAFTPDSLWLLTQHPGDSIKLWSVKSGRQTNQLVGKGASFSTDGRWAMNVNGDFISVYSIDSGHLTLIKNLLLKDTLEVNSSAIAPDGHWVMVTTDDGSTIMQVDGGKSHYVDSDNNIQFSPDSKRVISTDEENDGSTETNFLELESGESSSLFGDFSSMSYNGELVLMTSNALSTTHSCELVSRKPGGISRTLGEYDGTFSLDGNYVLTRTKLWPLRHGVSNFISIEESIPNVSPSSHWALLGGDFLGVSEILSKSGEIRQIRIEQDSFLRMASFLSNDYLILKGDSTHVNLYSLDLDSIVRQLPKDPIAFSSDGQRLLTKRQGLLTLWSTTPMDSLLSLQGIDSSVTNAVFSNSQKTVLTSSPEGFVLWSTANGKAVKRFPGHPLAYSSNGQWILTAQGNSVQLWSVDKQKVIHTLQGEKGVYDNAIFSPDGRWILTRISGENEVRLWSVESGKQERVLYGHRDVINSAVFSTHSRWVLTASMDKTVKIWSVETGQPLKTFFDDNEGILRADFLGDSNFVITERELPDFHQNNDYNSIDLWSVEKDCVECDAVLFTPAQLRTAGLQLEPEDLLPLWEQGIQLTDQELRYINKTKNKE